ncbi:MAG: hypothetical protein FJ119_03100 [Deltaproteobacteria bacterium]|nr:hypothetical protein [Deltaproteobacteria bacterium]
MPRQARLDSPGTLHHVIIRGIEKKPIVKTDTDREDFVSRLGRLSLETETAIYAWSLMTNHAHMLVRTSGVGLSKYMRRLLTGYAVNFNNRHSRHGHLFQNRYKSIVCDEDAYFQELVRYIHLNPLRARLVNDMRSLDGYRWSGHSAIVGKVVHPWQDTDYVLGWFGKTKPEARRRYREFVLSGIDSGKRPDLVGGGLLRSKGGWSQVISMRRRGVREAADARILGDGEFVDKILCEADGVVQSQFSCKVDRGHLQKVIRRFCKDNKLTEEDICSGSRRREISQARGRLALQLVREHGVSFAECARQLYVTTSAIAKVVTRNNNSD